MKQAPRGRESSPRVRCNKGIHVAGHMNMHVKDTKVHSYRREGGVGYSSRSEGHASVSQSMRASVDLPRHVQQSENILAKHGQL